jgi:hypothetical protein
MPQPLPVTFQAYPQSLSGDSNTIDTFELRASRRNLHNLKTLIPSQQMLSLIQSQIDEAEKYFKSIIAASDEQWKECRVDMHADSLTVKQIPNYRMQKMEALDSKNSNAKTNSLHDSAWEAKNRNGLDSNLKAHPEHYLIPDYDEGIIDVIGEHMARLRIRVIRQEEAAPKWLLEYGDKT